MSLSGSPLFSRSPHSQHCDLEAKKLTAIRMLNRILSSLLLCSGSSSRMNFSNKRMVTLGGAVSATSEMEILVDWTSPHTTATKTGAGRANREDKLTNEMRHPRQLKQSYSASNAFSNCVSVPQPRCAGLPFEPARNGSPSSNGRRSEAADAREGGSANALHKRSGNSPSA